MKTRRLSLLLALAVAANILELFIPSPPFLPWLKIGIANAFTMAAIRMYGPWAGIQMTVLRTFISGFISGIPATSLLIGGSGGVFSALVMGCLWHFFGSSGLLSLIGLGIAGSFSHTMAQLCVVYALFIKNAYIFWQIPILGPVSAATGTLTGILALYTCQFLENHEVPEADPFPGVHHAYSIRPLIKLFILVLGTGVFFWVSLLKIFVLSSLFLCIVLFFQRRSRTLALSLRFVPLFLLTFALNVFSEPGHFYTTIPFITHEGVYKSSFLMCRTLSIMLLSFALFTRQDCELLFTSIMRAVPSLSHSMEVALRGTAALPSVISILKDFYLRSPRKGFIMRIRYFREGFAGALADVLKIV
ncbi:MAG: hypothetical protein A2268_09655 [Candidatus Raymondbacteria bacterium RifOxyA12_full_50_37]|uniref:Heptaprenyl diphosphate synthase n=1 Tax=Candidatus Raymondbacteria bacterium RIFOXYD12_FULL_49_13 TaxID=1817890 RepID=A0A1F7F1D7_UNCRA|nr:MAG: hypothetical protein A2268_09655 [Candidatus Raymondbacteria bacterium RifOxyA12_full_50_37]OGJ93152.1 MAG: hypothetical protein A2350_17850 [Candidatus Raymondbacteria bacterium RifOxyB12_full_50_8]OGJ93895.1 MAG: hypothetical protein A2248_06640 [Candidatus Raymondbacteria bacterium RIFOXYA2_FULL_49_16]OGJ98236.1 MAG: hypothetical protein A2453_00525 [Candidatus Raymondbacteria bacterium RIFOXYC2_FULL_50_21]OGK00469.1 MAG: hypothetical protein A2519_10700 [Candidatus Raymondbacteria b